MTEILPDLNDLDIEQMVELALPSLGEAVDQKARQLRAAIMSDSATADVINAIRQEYIELAGMRLLMLTGKALDGLEKVMDERIDGKNAVAVVRASEVILDRSAFPKQTKREQGPVGTAQERVMPSLEQVLQKSGENVGAAQVIEQYRQTLKQVDELRRGAKQIIDVTPEGKEDV